MTKTTNNNLQEKCEDTKWVIGMNPYIEEGQTVECFVLFSFGHCVDLSFFRLRLLIAPLVFSNFFLT